MDKLIESNQTLSTAIAAQTMALHALAASNQTIADIIAQHALDDLPADGFVATTLDQVAPAVAVEQKERTL